MKFLSDEQLNAAAAGRDLDSSRRRCRPRSSSSDEYLPVPQTEKQREVEARLKELSGDLAKKQGLSRRRFFQTAAGMAASFVAINQVFGRIFDASIAEAATPDMANARAAGAVGADGDRRPHPFPARRHQADGLRQAARECRQVRLEQGAGREGTDHRGPEVQQLPEGNLPGQRHQGGAAVEFAVASAGRLVHPAGAGVRDAREGQPATPARAACWRISPLPRAGPAGSTRSTRRSSASSRIRGRATRSATTPTRSWRSTRGAPTTRS